ncbi:MAG: hypothetical protein K8R07_00850, partial [Desulfobacterales bacterium]|nr:hypothetical protein [Desulfobacterales bacterium]
LTILNCAMKCIDAIEGTIKYIISEFHQIYIEEGLDDTEYIRNIKAIIDGIDKFIQNNKEIISEAKMLKQVLYSFSKELWLANLEKSYTENVTYHDEDKGYYDYYFDYIYNHGVYPR